MDELENKLGAILNDPNLMQQLGAMAQSLGISVPGGDANQEPELPDPALIQRLAGLAGKSRMDQNQTALIHALSPYLNHSRIQKLERAIRAAKVVRLASDMFSVGGISLP